MDGEITIRHLQQYIKQKDFNPEKKHNYILKFMEESGEVYNVDGEKNPDISIRYKLECQL
ncbi:MAG: hypothetical protein FWF81_01705 [Defluviitaleaceae bacterium]|nr:hypothetical protein [Defluviitaleaceae bacterium]